MYNYYYRLPECERMKNKWYNMLKRRSFIKKGENIKICSKHFDKKYFDSMKNLKKSAIPTLFPTHKLLTYVSY